MALYSGAPWRIWAKQCPIFYPKCFWSVVSYKSVLKPKILEPCQPWRPWYLPDNKMALLWGCAGKKTIKKNSLCLDNRQNIHPIPNHKIYPIRFERHQDSSSRVRLIHFWRCRHRLACPKRESTWQMNVRSVWQNYVP